MVQGGFWGLVLIGIRRAVFSSESGVGLAPIYHGQSTSKKGTDEGLVGMLGPILRYHLSVYYYRLNYYYFRSIS